jgi:two-component system nitrogen regulation response regulator GlnG
MSEIWIVDDEANLRWVLGRALEAEGHRVEGFAAAEDVLARLAEGTPDVLISDIRLPGRDGLALLEELGRERPDLPVIVVTAYTDLPNALAAYGGGAFEYLPKPIDLDELTAVLGRALHARGVPARPALPPSPAPPSETLLGEDPAMQRLFRILGRLARVESDVLILGETGTGKELVARTLHAHGSRASGPFIAVNAAAIPEDLLESELFGHERGAFTGAVGQHVGRFEQARGGTLFLDEIGDMPFALQARLLRVLAEREFYRLGGRRPISVEARVLAATHRDLSALVREGRFREDLYHRLNAVGIRVPPLRERRGDIPMLLRCYLEDAARRFGTVPKRPTSAALERLISWPWSGNVRELQNLCRRLTLEVPGVEITPADLPEEMIGEGTPLMPASTTSGDSWKEALRAWLRTCSAEDFAATHRGLDELFLEEALGRSGGKRDAAARLLGIGRNTLYRRLRGRNRSGVS